MRSDLFGRAAIPALAGAFQPGRAGFAASFRWTRPDLPALSGELRIVDHVPAFDHVIQQLPGSNTFTASQVGLPCQELFVGRLVPDVLEDVQDLTCPNATGFVLFAVHPATRLVNVFAEVVKVESDSVQTQLGISQLGRNPTRSIDIGDSLVGLPKFQPRPLASQDRSDLCSLRTAWNGQNSWVRNPVLQGGCHARSDYSLLTRIRG